MGIDVGFRKDFLLKYIMIMNTHYVLGARLNSFWPLTHLTSSKILRKILSVYSFHIWVKMFRETFPQSP